MKEYFIFQVREAEYKKWFVDYLHNEMYKCDLEFSMYNIIKIFQVIELDLLEKILFEKWWLVFIKYLNQEVLIENYKEND